MVQETSEPRTTDFDPDQGWAEQDPTPDPPLTRKPVTGVPLERLLSVAVLNPAQALLVAVQLLDATHIRGPVDGVSAADSQRWSVTLTSSGELEVGPAQVGEGTQVTELLEQLSLTARQLPAHPSSEQLVLLRRLEETALDAQLEPGARARELEGALTEVLGSGARHHLTEQLAALVEAFDHIAPSIGVSVDAFAAPGTFRPDPRRAAPIRSTRGRPPRRGRAVGKRRARKRRMTLVVLVLMAALAGIGYVVLQGPGIAIPGASGRDDQAVAPSTANPSDSPKDPAEQPRPHPRQDVGTLAGRHAGSITGVEVQKTGSCTAGAPCPVTVTVHFRPSSTTQPVVWKVGTAQRCERAITWSPPVTVTAQPGWTTVYASSSIAVPRGRSSALVALTSTPSRAQSPPVPVAGSSQRC